jgi:hypothetical protein
MKTVNVGKDYKRTIENVANEIREGGKVRLRINCPTTHRKIRQVLEKEDITCKFFLQRDVQKDAYPLQVDEYDSYATEEGDLSVFHSGGSWWPTMYLMSGTVERVSEREYWPSGLLYESTEEALSMLGVESEEELDNYLRNTPEGYLQEELYAFGVEPEQVLIEIDMSVENDPAPLGRLITGMADGFAQLIDDMSEEDLNAAMAANGMSNILDLVSRLRS